MTQKPNFPLTAGELCAIAKKAGDVIMAYYKGDYEVTKKEDHSPVTQADLDANDVIIDALEAATPEIPIVSEENPVEVNEYVSTLDCYWIVDPLDGTKSFIHHTDEFTVNIALIKNKQTIFGVVYVPAQDLFYFVGDDGLAYKQQNGNAVQQIATRPEPEDGVVVIASKSHGSPETEEYIKGLNVQERISASSSVKLCLVAEGKADIYPRFGRTMEWDIAAGQAVLVAAGGNVKCIDGSELSYSKEGLDNPNFIAKGF